MGILDQTPEYLTPVADKIDEVQTTGVNLLTGCYYARLIKSTTLYKLF